MWTGPNTTVNLPGLLLVAKNVILGIGLPRTPETSLTVLRVVNQKDGAWSGNPEWCQLLGGKDLRIDQQSNTYLIRLLLLRYNNNQGVVIFISEKLPAPPHQEAATCPANCSPHYKDTVQPSSRTVWFHLLLTCPHIFLRANRNMLQSRRGQLSSI